MVNLKIRSKQCWQFFFKFSVAEYWSKSKVFTYINALNDKNVVQYIYLMENVPITLDVCIQIEKD